MAARYDVRCKQARLHASGAVRSQRNPKPLGLEQVADFGVLRIAAAYSGSSSVQAENDM